MTTPFTDFLALLAEERLVPVLRASSESTLRDQSAKVVSAGLRVIEITTTSPGWQRVISDLADTPGLTIGAGTVLTGQLARSATEAGAEFLVAPGAVPEVRAEAEIPLIEGAFSPSEVLSVTSRNRPVKLFPAATGGVAHLRALLDIAPDAVIVPTGGIRPGDAAAWLRAGAVAVGLGSALTAASTDDIRALRRELQSARR